MEKLHAKLKWSTIIDRLNKMAGYEKFRMQVDTIYILTTDKFDQQAFVAIGSTLIDKDAFIERYA